MNYADLQVTTHFSFLRGASSPEELFASAALLGIKALGIVDRNSLAGIVRAYEAAKTTGGFQYHVRWCVSAQSGDGEVCRQDGRS
jgi:DNA polymerase III alpha subunit